jgi:hypothetical protein
MQMEGGNVVVEIDEQPNGEVIEWRIVAGFDNYEVSNTGLVRNRASHKILDGSINRGYQQVSLLRDGSRNYRNVHQLVATTFLGDSEGLWVDHRDRNRLNNNVSNLHYVSPRVNNRNRSGRGPNIVYHYYDTLPEDAIVVDRYGEHEFENLYYVRGGRFFFWNGDQYRELVHLTRASDGLIYVEACNTRNRHIMICLAKCRRMINDMP